MTEFVIADTHFGHEKIISLCKRPFKNVKEMDHTLIQNWNRTVTSDNDTVWFLGDFSSYKDETKNEEIFNSLKGNKYLIRGNHDKNSGFLNWITSYDRMELVWIKPMIVLDHYPIEEWNGMYKGAIHLHGHVHGNPKFAGMKNRWDVGVENEWMNYSPVDLNWFIENRVK